jgi:hypothetical protein
MSPATTTDIGYTNRNGQRVIKHTSLSSNLPVNGATSCYAQDVAANAAPTGVASISQDVLAAWADSPACEASTMSGFRALNEGNHFVYSPRIPIDWPASGAKRRCSDGRAATHAITIHC